MTPSPTSPDGDTLLPGTLPDESAAPRNTSAARVLAGRYRLQTPLGAGGHAEVWDADDLLARERVAVKLLHRASDATAARVRREVAALRILRVPGVVRLLDEGVDAGRVFLVMERVDGGRFPGDAVRLGWDALRGPALGLLETLGRIHAAGVVHRDLKPANVLVNAEGRPTVLDFGLSYFDSSAGEQLTGEGEMLGTPAYLAPEQINSGPITARTDLYAVGVMLYEALTGRLPHDGRDLMHLMRARLTQRPRPVRDLAPEVPALVADVVARLLAVEPGDRPRSAAEVIALLRGRPAPEATAFPRLGSVRALRELLDAVEHGRAVDVTGAPGVGRTRLLRDAARELARRGRTAVFLLPSQRAFASLEPLVGAPEPRGDASLSRMREAMEARVREAFAQGTVLFADDADRLDPASAVVLARARDAGALVRAYAGGPREGSLHFEALDEPALRALFAGPDRIAHLREDAAHELFARTEGNPRKIVHEVDAWIRAGLGRWDGTVLVVARDALDRLEGGARLAAPSADETPPTLPPHLAELLAWVALAWPHSTPAVLAGAMGEPLWRVEAEGDELCERGAARRLDDGRIEALARADGEEHWSPAHRAAALRALVREMPRGSFARLAHLLATSDEGDEATREIAREATELGRRLAQQGQLGRAVVALGEGLRAARPSPACSAETDALLATWVEVAMAEGTPRALDRVLYELCRVEPRTLHGLHLEALVRAALAIDVWTDRALDLAESIAPFDDAALDRQRLHLRVVAGRRASQAREQAVLDELARDLEVRSGRDPEARAAFAGWLGRLRYREGRFDEAARLQEQAASGTAWVTARANAQVNAASAYMEAFRLEDAQRLALEARALARACRHAYPEARAEWILRSVAYRSGAPGTPDRDLVDAVAYVGSPLLEAMVSLNEAAVAYRAGDLATARELARRAQSIWTRAGESLGQLLASALLVASGGELEADKRAALATNALGCPARGVGIQVLGLLARGDAGFRVAAADALALAEMSPRASWGSRMEVLSVDEALEALGHRAATG